MKLLFYLELCFFLGVLLLLLIFFLSFRTGGGEPSKGAPFECGFQSFSKNFFPFSLPFFFVSLMFLLFDVELLLLVSYPIFFFMKLSMDHIFYITLVVVYFSTLYEWSNGLFDWV